MFALTLLYILVLFFFKHTASTEIYTLSLHDALPIYRAVKPHSSSFSSARSRWTAGVRKSFSIRSASSNRSSRRKRRSEEHTSELQSQFHLVCRLLLEKKNQQRHEPAAPPLPRRVLAP